MNYIVIKKDCVPYSSGDGAVLFQDNIIADYKEITRQMSEKLERRERGGEGEREEREGNTSPLVAAQARIHELELGNASSLPLSLWVVDEL
jgi:hypothetical protein